MTISVGDKLPDATLQVMGEDGVESLSLGERVAGRKVVIFGLPGAFTGTCTTAHVPSFIRTAEAFAAKGVDEIICLSNNDAFVMEAWAKSTGADAAGIAMLADVDAEYAKGTGLAFSVDAVGFHDRIQRHSLYAEDGVVKQFNAGDPAGSCEISAGETLLEQI